MPDPGALVRARVESLARGDGGWTPPTPRRAATVCLLREGPAGLEVFVMRRTTSMAFAASMHVYPGGAVEVSDSSVPVAGRGEAQAARIPSPGGADFVVAAARETFEECGVLLAVSADGARVVPDDSLDADREALVGGTRSFADLLVARGLVVDDGALVPFAHWVTPEVEDRRYDTAFLAAALPPEQDARHLGGEADRSAWWRPAEALSAYAEGRMAMWPPTLSTMRFLARHDDPASVLDAAARVDVVPLLPEVHLDTSGALASRLLDARTRVVLGDGDEPPSIDS